jgi:acetoin:2,6-dichlorophenolindophenol oxidoreductase subunit beta
MREAIRLALREEMRADPDVFMMGEDIGVYGGAFAVSDGLLQEFGPRRIRDTPISEEAFVGAAVGAAMLGMRPIVEVQFFDFITDAMDQIVNQAAKTRFMLGGTVSVPLVVRGPAGSGTGAAAQHSQSLENWFVHVPGLKVVMPSTPADARGLLKSSIRDNNPVIFVENKLLYNLKGPVETAVDGVVPLGLADIRRVGSDVTVVATGMMVPRALAAANGASEQGIEVEVIDPRTLKPLDEETIVQSVSKTGRLIVVHEAVRAGGFGGEVAAVVAASDAFDYLDAPIIRLGGRDMPIPYNRTLEAQVVPSEADILRAIVELVSHRR